MNISDLSYSPAAMFIDGIAEDIVQRQSELYKTDIKKVKELCQQLEVLLPAIVIELKRVKNSQLPKEQWLVLSASIIHSLVAFLLLLEIVDNTQKSKNIEDDVKTYKHFFPQTQDQLLKRLSYDRELHNALFSIAKQILGNKPPIQKYENSVIDVYSLFNLKSFAFKKFFSKKLEITPKNKSKSRVLTLSANHVAPYLTGKLPKKYELINIDSFLNSLAIFPSSPNMLLRKQVAIELDQAFKVVKLQTHIPLLKNKSQVEEILATMIANLLPISLLEKYSSHANNISKIFDVVNPDITITTTAHHAEFPNLCLSLLETRKVPLITFQHGSSYAEFATMQSERTIENALYKTTYFSWGTGYKLCQGKQNIVKLLPLGAPYLQALPKQGFKQTQIKKVVIPLDPLYYYQVLESFIPVPPGYVFEQYQTIIEFTKYILKKYPDINIVMKVKVGHENQKAIKKYFTEAELKNIEFTSVGKTSDYFNEHTLLFAPIFSGAANEAIAAEAPFLVYVPKDRNYFKPQMNTILEELRKQFLVGTNLKELQTAFDKHYAHIVSYKKNMSTLNEYRHLANLKNDNKSFTEILLKYLS